MNPYIKQANQQFVPVYNRYPIVWDHGEGMYLYDTEGKRYLDFGSGIGVCALGYHDPNYTCTLQEQMENVRAMTTYLDKALSELAAQKVVIKEVRGLGLMKGIELSVPAAYYINALQEAGIIVIPSGSHVIRLLPPLILEKEHIDALLYVLKKIL